APHRNPPLPNQQQQPKTAGANSKLDKTGGKVRSSTFDPAILVLEDLQRRRREKLAAAICRATIHSVDAFDPHNQFYQ
ncbi:hypothetical protein, partial [Rhizobium laguerreae]|uniref:hypothetical protein n=1 Tax=Rhizobium laguerreae TaxID=1076926 RepID=UPI00197E23D7